MNTLNRSGDINTPNMERRRPQNVIVKSFHLKLTNKFRFMDLASIFVILLTFGLIQSGEYTHTEFFQVFFMEVEPIDWRHYFTTMKTISMRTF